MNICVAGSNTVNVNVALAVTSMTVSKISTIVANGSLV
jgi:hypothetical protein